MGTAAQGGQGEDIGLRRNEGEAHPQVGGLSRGTLPPPRKPVTNMLCDLLLAHFAPCHLAAKKVIDIFYKYFCMGMAGSSPTNSNWTKTLTWNDLEAAKTW